MELVRKQSCIVTASSPGSYGARCRVQKYAQGFARRTGIEAKVTATDETIRFSGDIETAFRCIQESLTNVARHSGAERVTIAFKYLADSIHVCIKDNGKGFDQDVLDGSSGRLGITGMCAGQAF